MLEQVGRTSDILTDRPIIDITFENAVTPTDLDTDGRLM